MHNSIGQLFFSGISSTTLNDKEEEFIESESKKKRPYPKRFDVAVPANMNCGKEE